MNDKYSTTEGKTSEKLSDEAMLSAQWKNIDWHKAEREVNRLQIRIVKATQQKDYNAVKRLQYLLTHSFYAKALAVKRVVTNDGRRSCASSPQSVYRKEGQEEKASIGHSYNV